eukprot:GEMP01043925.1.p1 GENE.GEMP01043925.1~~GEMP01043925.1.p1  ORF type:complete len:183 (+),score=22.20 GEMP01043925.1:81-629(+)
MGECHSCPRSNIMDHTDDMGESHAIVHDCWSYSCHEDGILKANASQNLIIAAKRGDLKAAHSALRSRADVNTRLHVVFRKGSIEARNNAGSSRNAGLSPLMFAAKEGNIELAQLLLDWRAKVNAEEEDGYRALHFACLNGHFDVACLLIQHGANPDALTHNNLRPLDLCAPEDTLRFQTILL